MFLTVAFLAAGKGTRFSKTGAYDVPKILIPVGGTPMAVKSYHNLIRQTLMGSVGEDDIFSTVVAITDEFDKAYPEFRDQLQQSVPELPINFHIQRGYVDGPARTAEQLKFMIPPNEHLLLSNVDQLVSGDMLGDIKNAVEEGYDGVIFCFESNEDRYSYVTVDENNVATSMIEKKVVSNMASSGHIFFKEAETLFSYIDEAIFSREVGSETYISDVCNEAIKSGLKFKVSMLKSFTDMGTPDDLKRLES